VLISWTLIKFEVFMVMEFIQMMDFWIVLSCHTDNKRLLRHITLVSCSMEMFMVMNRESN